MKSTPSKPSQEPEEVTFPYVEKAGNVAVRIYKTSTTKTTKEGPRTYLTFMVADFTGGRRKLRPFSDFTEAKREAKRIAAAIAGGQKVAASLTDDQALSYAHATNLLKGTGLRLENVASNYAEAVKRLDGDRVMAAVEYYLTHGPGNHPKKRVREVIDELLASKKAKGKSARYLEDLRSKLGRFVESFDTTIASIAGPQIQHWLDGLGVAPLTAKGFRTVCHSLFAYAERRGYIAEGRNPVRKTEKVEVKDGEVEIYTPEEIGKLLAAADQDFLPCLAIGAFAGLRSAEIERLRGEDVDFVSGHIKLSAGQTKTASRRLVPLSDNLKVWLAPCVGQTGMVWCGDHKGFYDAQAETAARAGIKWKANALRHSFVSCRLAQTRNAGQTALEAGNSPAIVFKHYRELVTPKEAATWFSLRPAGPANVLSITPAARAK